MSDSVPISTLADLTNRPIITATPVSSSDHEAWRNDLETRVANLNDAMADEENNRAGSSPPTDNTVRGRLYADTTNASRVILKLDPDGSGADDEVATRLEAFRIAFATGGTATHKLMGVINSQFTEVGNVGAGADTLMSFTLPANTLDTDGKALRIRAAFKGNGVDNVTLTFIFGATGFTIRSGTSITTAEARLAVDIIVIRTSSNNQLMSGVSIEGSTAASNGSKETATDTGNIGVQFQGENTSDATNDAIIQQSMIVELLN